MCGSSRRRDDGIVFSRYVGPSGMNAAPMIMPTTADDVIE